MNKYFKTIYMSATEKTAGGAIYLLPDVLIRIFTLISLIYLWRAAMSTNIDVGMNLNQILAYTCISALLSDMLAVKTAASGWLSEGVLLRLFGHPLPVLGNLIAQTIGGWVPMLLMFSLPMMLILPLFKLRVYPSSPFFFVSLLLCITLGFAIDFLFACLSIKLRNMNWLIGRMRVAVNAVLSGTIIPINLLPFGIAEIVKYQPFASLGGAPLSIFVGTADITQTILLQFLWNAVLWPFTLFVWKKSQEGMVSYGG